MEQLLEYIEEYKGFFNLVSYHDFRDGLIVGKKRCLPFSDNLFVKKMHIPKKLKHKKDSMAREIASHLWKEDEEVKDIFETLKISSIREISYGTVKPLKVKVSFEEGSIHRVFYAKPMNERRFIGLELENLLLDYKYNFVITRGGIYEEEINGRENWELPNSVLNDPAYLEELFGLDFRCYVFLLGDMHDQNFLVSKIERGYQLRPIDFDKIFYILFVNNGFVLSKRKRREIIKKLGTERCETRIKLEQERLKKNYVKNKEKMKDLLDIIGFSKECNNNLSSLVQALGNIYVDIKKEIYCFRNMGQLFKMHLQRQIGIKD